MEVSGPKSIFCILDRLVLTLPARALMDGWIRPFWIFACVDLPWAYNSLGNMGWMATFLS